MAYGKNNHGNRMLIQFEYPDKATKRLELFKKEIKK